MGGRKTLYEDLPELAAKESVRTWVEGLTEGPSRKHGVYSLHRYTRWRRAKSLEYDPEKWVAECRDGTVKTLIAHLKTLQEYVRSPEFDGDDNETRKKHYFRIRGFYEANFVPLPDVKLKLPANGNNKVEVEVTASSFLQMAGKVLSTGRLCARDRSIILTMIQSGMDASTLTDVFNYAGYPQLVSVFGSGDPGAWDTAECPVKVELFRPKSSHRFYSFLDVDGIDALKDWLGVRTRDFGRIRTFDPKTPNELATSEPIYVNRYGQALVPHTVTGIFRESGKRAGVSIEPSERPEQFKGARIRYAWHSHECRDTIRTLARGRADTVVAEFILGHEIDRLGYDKSPWNDSEYFRREYAKMARPWLNPISGKALEVERWLRAEFEQRLSALERQIQEQLSKRDA